MAPLIQWYLNLQPLGGGGVGVPTSPGGFGMNAIRRYPKLLHPERWCRNNDLPDAYFARLVEKYLNHCIAYRRKTWLAIDGELASATEVAGSASDVVYWRARGLTGYGVSQLRFKVLIGRWDGAEGTPTVEIDVTPAGGSPTTYRLRHGALTGTATDVPNQLVSVRRHVPVNPATTYEIAIRGVDGGRPISVACYEWAKPEVDDARPYFVEIGPGALFPIDDRLRQALVEGASKVWRANGAHLLTFAGRGDGSARSITGTTWTNLLDGTSTGISAATPGYYFVDEAVGDVALETLAPLVRLKDTSTFNLPVTLAVYGKVSTGAEGEVRCLRSDGTSICSITGITTTLKWHTVDTTLNAVDVLDYLNLQLRNGTAGRTTDVYAASLYCRDA